jgi:hypothetical protein
MVVQGSWLKSIEPKVLLKWACPVNGEAVLFVLFWEGVGALYSKVLPVRHPLGTSIRKGEVKQMRQEIK